MGASLSFPEEEINHERTYLITGGNSGIGYEAAKTIAGLGAHVIIACRNLTKAETAVKNMQEEYIKDFSLKMEKELEANRRDPRKLNIEIMELDLASFAATKRFIEAFKARNCKLNVLVCNAGIAVKSKELTEDGYEMMLQANYLSHLLIILHFLPILTASGDDSRIVQTSSIAHTVGKFDLTNINAQKSWGEITFYGSSKLYQIMSMLWLIRNIKSIEVTISSCHPGIVYTQMTQTNDYLFVRAFAKTYFARSAFEGAATIIKAAIDNSLQGQTGIYMSDCKIKTPSSLARDPEKQDELMKWSLESLKPHLPENLTEILNYDQ
ncbi:hypothetical protein LOTGIDRAFT_181561 [Lottia gigantea]|uniref:Uncharacterized protein n=1 Tax=Lottia gigantea TaxID=225164 RepID=V4C7A3_LOTGI|nr:hypothetical protein LOTGIDRAFT_181561 [Lottia gigantea]ESO97564.1 hypothetical protein LOTGIDRAFT_181561 [Lottia gigantea]